MMANAAAPTLDTLSWSRVRAAFDRALDLDHAARAQLLDMLAREDAAAAQAVAELLATHARHLGRTEAAHAHLLADAAHIVAPEPRLGARFGAYALERELGRGGMGVVYAARRVDGAVEQTVAIKVLQRGGLDTASLQRFRLERELIARLAHPNIARLYDAGETDDGSPYFVMEYVDGVPLTAYCDRERLDLRARLRLFARVCEAVQYAHGQLVLHRDLKPGNVLVDRHGEPHLIDFGIARRLDADAASTVTAQRFFSPAHAAPEQLRGEAVGVTCDVYQLGTVLYELLCGAPVFEFHDTSPSSWETLIREHVPLAPSHRVAKLQAAGVQARGCAQHATLAAQLRGDLDNMTLMSLRKRPQERYASVDRMLDDVHAYLDGRPMQAGGGQAWYRLRKFIARHRVGVAIAGLFALTVAAGIGAVLWQARVAQERADALQQVADFQARMLEQVDPARAGKLLSDAVASERARVPLEDASAQAAFEAQWARLNATDIALKLLADTVLEPASVAIDRQFANQPEIDARLRATLANTYSALGLHDRARPLFEHVLATHERLHGAQARETLRARLALASAWQDLGEFERAEALTGRAYADTRAFGADDPDALEAAHRHANLRMAQGRAAEAEALYVPTLAARRRVFGDQHPGTLDTMTSLAVAYWDQGKLAQTEPLLREVLDVRRRIWGERHMRTLLALSNVGALARDLGRRAEAEVALRECLDAYREVVGSDHPRTLVVANLLALIHSENGRLAEAEELNRAVLAARRRTLGNHHPETATSVMNLAASLLDLGRPDQAEPLAREAVAMFEATVGADPAFSRIAKWRLGDVLVARGATQEALALLTPMEQPMRDLFAEGDNAYRLARYLHTLGRAHAGANDRAQALARVREACAIFAKTPGPDPRYVDSCQRTLVELEGNAAGG